MNPIAAARDVLEGFRLVVARTNALDPELVGLLDRGLSLLDEAIGDASARSVAASEAAKARWGKRDADPHAGASSASLSDLKEKEKPKAEREAPPIVRDAGTVHRGDPIPVVALELARKRRPDLTDDELRAAWGKFADRYHGTRGRGRWRAWIDAERVERAPPAPPAPPASETRMRAAPSLSESERRALAYEQQGPGPPPMRLADTLARAQAPPAAARTG